MLRYLITTVVALTTLFSQAQTARSLFDSIPQAILPLLTDVNRADFVDFKESNMQAKVKNRLGETSEMTDLTDSYIRINLTERSTWEMKTLIGKDSTTVICVVHTVCAPVCDSNIKFYSTDWKELPAERFLSLPQVADFPIAEDGIAVDSALYKYFLQTSDIALRHATLLKEKPILSVRFTTPEYFSKDDIKKMESLSLLPLTYVWRYDEAVGNYRFVKE